MDSPQRYGMRLHSAVWPGVEQAMFDANMRNFTIFRHGDLLFGYYEYIGDDHDADQARIRRLRNRAAASSGGCPVRLSHPRARAAGS